MTKQELIEQRKQQLLAQNYTADAAQAEAERMYAGVEDTPVEFGSKKLARKQALVEDAADATIEQASKDAE